MKKMLLFLPLLFLFVQSHAKGFPTPSDQISPSLVISSGYVPSYNGIKAGVAYNNFFKRLGAYTSIENGLDDGEFFHILGGTVSLLENLYVFAGLDLFTEDGGLINKGINGRKSMGVAWAPIPNAVIKPGWSGSIGFTIEAGFRLPLMKVADN